MDPRRKLQIVSAANPSLRLSVAPPTVHSRLNGVTTAPAQRLQLQSGQTFDRRADAATQPQTQRKELPKLNFAQQLRDRIDANTESDRIKRVNEGRPSLHEAPNPVTNAVAAPFRPFAQGLARLLPGGQADIAANERAQAQTQRDQDMVVGLYKQGKISKEKYRQLLGNLSQTYSGQSKEAQRIADTADRSQVAGSAAIVPLSIFAPGSGVLRNVAFGAGFGGVNEIATKADPSIKEIATGAGIGGTLGGGATLLAKGASNVINRIAPSKPVQANISKYLAKETDENAIGDVLAHSLGIDKSELGDLTRNVAAAKSKRAVNKQVKSFLNDYVPGEQALISGSEDLSVNLAANQDPQSILETITSRYPGLSNKAKKSLSQKIANEQNPTNVKALLDAADNITGSGAPKPTTGETPKGASGEVPAVVQIIDKKTGAQTYKTIPEGGLDTAKGLIDASDIGVAGKEIDGKVYHITAKTPEQMEQRGFTNGGEFTPEEIPTPPTVTPQAGQMTPEELQVLADAQGAVGNTQKAVAQVTGDAPEPAIKASPEVSTAPQISSDQATVADDISKAATERPTILKTQPEIKPTSARQRPAGFAESLSQTETPEAVYRDLLEISTKPNSSTFAQASQDIDANEQAVLSDILGKSKGTLNDVDNARALLLLDKAIAEDNIPLATQIAGKINSSGTENARAVQILSAVNKTTPSGAFKEAQKIVTEAQEKGLLPKDYTIPPEKLQAINDKAVAIQALETGTREHEIAVAQLVKELKDIVPPELGDKLNSLVNISLLLNPKTFVRNVIGNTAGAVAETASTAVATPLDMLAALRTGNRTVALPSVLKRFGGFGTGLKQGAQETELGIRIGTGGKYDINPAVFTNRYMARIEKTLGHSLSDLDKAFAKAQFEDTLNSLMKAQKVNKPTQEMLDIAEQEGLYATYQGNSFIANSLQGAKGWLNKANIKGFGLGDVVVRYPKTPGNLVAVGMDYSPYGFVKGLVQFAKLTEGSTLAAQRQAVRNLGRGITGSGLIAGGYYLAKNNIITAKKSSDADLNSLQRAQGQPPFSFNITALGRLLRGEDTKAREGDVVTTYDWLQPNAIQLSMGANMALNKGEGATDLISTTLDQAASGLETIQEQPVLAQTGKFFKTAATPADQGGGIPNAIVDAVTGVPSMFVPSVVNQTAAVTDANARTTYDPNPVKQGVNKVVGKLPFANRTLEPVIDTFGNEVKRQQTDNPITKIFNSFVNPAFVTKIQRTPEGQMVLDIYNNTGETSQVPRLAARKQSINKDGSEGSKAESYTLSSKEITEFQKVTGKLAKETFAELANNPSFMALGDEEKAKVMSDKLRDINSFAKVEVLGNKPKTTSNGVKALMSGNIGSFSSKVPEGVSDNAKNYYEKTAYMDDKKLKEYLKGEPDDVAQNTAKELNSKKPVGVNDLPAYNGLSKRFAEFEKAKIEAQKDGNWSKLDEQKKTKEFWKGAVKDSKDPLAKDVYDNGTKDIEQYIKDGWITKADLDAAIELDNELYGSDLTSSLKFGKTFRRKYGYGIPSKVDPAKQAKASGGGKGGKGKAGKSVAGLGELKLRFNPPDAPDVTAKPNRAKAKFKFNVPGSVQVTPVRLKL